MSGGKSPNCWDMGMDQYLLIPFLVGTGVQGFDTLPYESG